MALTLKSGLGYVEAQGDLVAGATMYELERSPQGAGTWTIIETMPYPYFIDTPETGFVPTAFYDYRYRGKIVGSKFAVAGQASILPRFTFPTNGSATALQDLINGAPPGSIIDPTPGTYYLNGAVLNNNSKAITIRAQNRDVIISGARNYNDTGVNAAWTSVGSYWRSTRTAPDISESGFTEVDSNAAQNFNNVTGWKNGVPTRFKAKAAGTTTLAADEYCWEGGADKRIRLGGTNPATRFDRVHVCEQTDWWFTNADNVKFEGITFMDAGSGPFGNPIGNNDRAGFELRNCQIAFTHGVGISFGWPTFNAANTGSVVEKCLIREHGVNGLTMLNAAGYRFENNTWVNNGHLYYEWRESGGIYKVVLSTDGIVRYNVSRGTTGGGGLWWDIHCDRAVANWNKIGNCAGTAAWPEISRAIDIFDSCFYNGGTEDGGPTIHLSSAYDCETARNLVVGSGNGADSGYGRVWQVTDDSDVRGDIIFGVGQHQIHDNVSDKIATANNPHHVWGNSLIPGKGVSWNANKWYSAAANYSWLWGGSVYTSLATWNAVTEVGTDITATAGEVLALKKWWGLTTDDSPVAPPGVFTAIRIDSGSFGPYVDSLGQTWASDQSWSGDSTALLRGNAIANTADPTLYQSERYGATFSYTFGVPNDTYNVRLKFAELHWTGTGQRVFNVAINGTTVLSSFDIFSQAGGANIALDKDFKVVVAAAAITISFTSTTDNAKIDAIEITTTRTATVVGRLGPRGRTTGIKGVAEVPPEPVPEPTPPPVPGVAACEVLYGVQERLVYITPDDVEFMLSAPWYVMQEDGFGMPPLEFVTQRGPFQHGETVKDIWVRPKVMQLMIRRSATSRTEYQNLRMHLINTLRFNRGPGHGPTPGRLRKYLANGRVVEWQVYASEGPGFPSHDPNIWDQWSIQDSIRFTAYDPIARDPRLKSVAYGSTGVVGLFPITFPFQIASFGTSSPINYAGTWDTFPRIVLNGPLTGPIIRNLATDEKLSFTYSIPTGRTVTIDLEYGRKTVTLDDGTNLVGYMTSDSDVGSFHLQPGTNTLQIFATGTSGGSSVMLFWFDRYLGV